MRASQRRLLRGLVRQLAGLDMDDLPLIRWSNVSALPGWTARTTRHGGPLEVQIWSGMDLVYKGDKPGGVAHLIKHWMPAAERALRDNA